MIFIGFNFIFKYDILIQKLILDIELPDWGVILMIDVSVKNVKKRSA